MNYEFLKGISQFKMQHFIYEVSYLNTQYTSSTMTITFIVYHRINLSSTSYNFIHIWLLLFRKKFHLCNLHYCEIRFSPESYYFFGLYLSCSSKVYFKLMHNDIYAFFKELFLVSYLLLNRTV